MTGTSLTGRAPPAGPGTARFDLTEAAAALRTRRIRAGTTLGFLAAVCFVSLSAIVLARSADGSGFLLAPLLALGGALLGISLTLYLRPIPTALDVSSTGVTFHYPARSDRVFDWTDPGFHAELGEMRPLPDAQDERRYSIVPQIGVPVAPPGYRAVFTMGWGRDFPLSSASLEAIVASAAHADRIEEDVSQEGARFLTRYVRLVGPMPG